MSFLKRKKIAFVSTAVVFFMLGFFVHASFFPYMFVDLFVPSAQKKESAQSPAQENDTIALTTVSYTDGSFTPRLVQMKKSYYLRIVNNSESELMWLTSSHPVLNTPRGYGKSEELRTILYEPGTYEVSSTLHPDRILKVIVQ